MSSRREVRKVRAGIAGVVVAVAVMVVGMAGPALADTSGPQRFVIAFSGPLSEALTAGRPVVASGVLTSRGHEQFVSQGPGPTPGSFVAQTNFVFPEGTLFLSITGRTLRSRDFGPGNCFHLDASRATYQITGGTGQLAGATGSGTATITNIIRRTPTANGCSEENPTLTSSIHARGTLTVPSAAAA